MSDVNAQSTRGRRVSNARELDAAALKEFYGVRSASLSERFGLHESPLGGMFGVLPAGQTSVEHSHHETEVFIVLAGTGSLLCGTGSERVEPGSMFSCPAFETHALKADSTEDLRFVSFWWDDAAVRAGELERYRRSIQSRTGRLLVTATPPTPNGDLHLGHLSGPFLAADVLARASLADGVAAHTVCGIDDNQSYVPLRANQGNETPERVAGNFGERIEQVWRLASMKFDAIVRPDRSPGYVSYVQDFFGQLYASGALVLREREALFCKSTGRYLFEAHVRGRCPHCSAESDGSACEACGLPNQCVDLVNPRSKYGDGSVETRRVQQLVLPLEQQRATIEAFWNDVPMQPRLQQLCRRMAERELPEIAMTHPTPWGLPCPLPGLEGQVYYVWAEMAAGFSYAFQHMLGLGRLDASTEWVQCFGFDNANFYVALFPALWRAHRKDAPLPTRFATNEFLLLDGSKFSTSRRHAIWGLDFMEARNPDKMRLFLARVSPERHQADFRLAEYDAHVQAFWHGEFAPWLEAVAALGSASDGALEETGAWSKQHVEFLAELDAFKHSIRSRLLPAAFALSQTAWEIEGFVRRARRLGRSEDITGAGASRDHFRTAAQLQAGALLYVAVALSCICVNTGSRLWSALGCTGDPNWRMAEALQLRLRRISVAELRELAAAARNP